MFPNNVFYFWNESFIFYLRNASHLISMSYKLVYRFAWLHAKLYLKWYALWLKGMYVPNQMCSQHLQVPFHPIQLLLYQLHSNLRQTWYENSKQNTNTRLVIWSIYTPKAWAKYFLIIITNLILLTTHKIYFPCSIQTLHDVSWQSYT